MSIITTLLGTRNSVRFLTLADRDQLRNWMMARPAQCAFCLGWLDRFGMSGSKENRFFDFVVIGAGDDWELVALIVHGALLCVMKGDELTAKRLGLFLSKRSAVFQTLVGPDIPVTILSEALNTDFNPPRVDQSQVLMQRKRADAPVHTLNTDDRFRKASLKDLALVVDATLRMHEEEIGVPNTDRDVDSLIRSTYQKLQEGRIWICEGVHAGQLDFKASISLPTDAVAQIEGVWTNPERRGKGVARRCLHSMCGELEQTYPMLSLTVGAANEHAIRLYRALGFEEIQPWRTVYLDD